MCWKVTWIYMIICLKSEEGVALRKNISYILFHLYRTVFCPPANGFSPHTYHGLLIKAPGTHTHCLSEQRR